MNQLWINILNSFPKNVQVDSKKEFYKEATAIQFFPYCNFKFRAKFHVCLFVYFDFLKQKPKIFEKIKMNLWHIPRTLILDSRNMSVSKSLKVQVSLVLSISRRLSSNRAKASLKLFKEVNPNDCKLMLQTKTRRFKDKKEVQVKTSLYLSELRCQLFWVT